MMESKSNSNKNGSPESKTESRRGSEYKETESKPKRDAFEIIEAYGGTLDKEFEDFASDHFEIFESSTELTTQDEHPIAFNDVYHEYLERFATKVEKILQKEGIDSDEFYRQAKEILDTYPRGHPRKIFVQTILATTDYDIFFTFMKEEIGFLRKTKRHK